VSDDGYKISNKEAAHFIALATVEWVDEFARKSYRDILLDSIRHCQKEKDLILHAWCVMSNHIPIIT
jgi:putative transposase